MSYSETSNEDSDVSLRVPLGQVTHSTPVPYQGEEASSSNEELHITNPEIFALGSNESLSEHTVRIQTVQGQKKNLVVSFITVPGGVGSQPFEIKALVDTGCEVNLIRN